MPLTAMLFLARGRSEEPTRFAGWVRFLLGCYPMRKPKPGPQMRVRFAADQVAAKTNEQRSWWVNVIEALNLTRAASRGERPDVSAGHAVRRTPRAGPRRVGHPGAVRRPPGRRARRSRGPRARRGCARARTPCS